MSIARVPQGLVRRGEELAARLFEKYRPHILIIQKTDYPGSRRSRHLPAMTKAIATLARRRGITVIEYTPHEIQEALAAAGTRLTKVDLCQAIAEHYPALVRYLPAKPRGIDDTEPYRTPLFMAVALGLTWARRERMRP